MSAIAALLDSRTGLAALRRSLPRGRSPGVVACRTETALERAYQVRLLDAVVLGLKAVRRVDLAALRARYPAIPIVVYGGFRPADGDLALSLLQDGGIAALAVEGVDDPVVGALVYRHGLGGLRERALADAPRLLRLREPIQRDTWLFLVRRAGDLVSTSEAAEWLGVSREHLSRQFGAGGAPNLKRVLDLLRVICAGQLLGNPGYDLGAVARILGFSSTSHLHATTRRITGRPAGGLAALGPRGILTSFVRVGTRSRG